MNRFTPQQASAKGTSRHTRTPNLNMTICDPVGGGSSTSKRLFKSRSRPNLDVTVLGNTSQPKIKPVSAVPAYVDHELEADFVYNDYLQSLLKQQIVLNQIESHKEVLTDQLNQHKEVVYQMFNKHHEMQREISKEEKLMEIKEIFDYIETCLAEFDKIERQFNLNCTLNSITAILNKACNKLIFKNVKAITTEEEYNKLKTLLQSCSNCIENLLRTTNNSDEVEQLAVSITNYCKLQNELKSEQDFVVNQSEQLVYKLLDDLSDVLAVENGY